MGNITQARTEALNGNQLAYINQQINPEVLVIYIDGTNGPIGDASNISVADQDEADIYISDASEMTDQEINDQGGATTRPAKTRGSFNSG